MKPLSSSSLAMEPGLKVVVELETCAQWRGDLLVWGGLRWDVLLGLKVLWTLVIGGQECPQRWWRQEAP